LFRGSRILAILAALVNLLSSAVALATLVSYAAVYTPSLGPVTEIG
jgi:heme O synthase-like polyprenyltransferase